jgi:hypothetical protein
VAPHDHKDADTAPDLPAGKISPTPAVQIGGRAGRSERSRKVASRIRFEPARDGARWRVEHEGGDVEGHRRYVRFVVEDEDAEGHRYRGYFSLEPDGEDEGGEPLYRISGEGDVEGHAGRFKFFSQDDPDAEGHARIRFSLEPTGEEEGGDPVYRMQVEGDDAEGHRRRFHS